MEPPPLHLDLRKDKGLTIQWQDGSTSYLSIALLRRQSPSADMRQLRDEMDRNPLTILPAGTGGPMTALTAELAGNYGLKITFSDGHSTGIYTWQYLRDMAAGDKAREGMAPGA